ncbi:tuberin [Culex quinquefasciatus]|uniref:Tuberin n=1 Tax=Culex quinquefasciatus TaxID=7176 RepID=B0WZQ1_CULQU|nr:tuberin [Culex quinquefasciatus]|eukprot:XP_001862873.1 tuberin [Culex quinquefasciatus]
MGAVRVASQVPATGSSAEWPLRQIGDILIESISPIEANHLVERAEKKEQHGGEIHDSGNKFRPTPACAGTGHCDHRSQQWCHPDRLLRFAQFVCGGESPQVVQNERSDSEEDVPPQVIDRDYYTDTKNRGYLADPEFFNDDNAPPVTFGPANRSPPANTTHPPEGLAGWERRKRTHLLQRTDKLLQELRNLDNQKCREMHKNRNLCGQWARRQEQHPDEFLRQHHVRDVCIARLGGRADVVQRAVVRGRLRGAHLRGVYGPHFQTHSPAGSTTGSVPLAAALIDHHSRKSSKTVEKESSSDSSR